jgi:hypothetical protein
MPAPPRRLSYDLKQKHLVFAAAENDPARRGQAAAMFKKAAAARDKPTLEAILDQARRDGISVLKIARHFHP